MENRPPRRDPRILVIRASQTGLAYGALDAWDVAGMGELGPPTALKIARLLLRIKPSGVLWLGAAPASAKSALKVTGVSVIELKSTEVAKLRRLAPTPAALTAEYPALGPVDAGPLMELLQVAAAALILMKIQRQYARRGQNR